MKNILLLSLLALSGWCSAQVPESLTLSWCHENAIRQYPLIQQRDLLEKISAEKIRNLQTNYYPQMNVNGQVSYQSDVTQIPIKTPFFNVPEMDKDLYKFYLDVNQVIFDGGLTKQQKALETVQLSADKQNLEAQLYQLKERINQLYFSILLIQSAREVLVSTLDDLDQRQSRIEAGVAYGVVLESQLNVLKAEKLKIQQQLLEMDANREAGLAMLGEFLNLQLPADTRLALPDTEENMAGTDNRRLEPLVLELQQKKLEVSKDLASSKYLPKIFAFAQAGYGKPALNMLNNEFDTYWLVGARFSWNLWNWNQLGREHKILDLQKEVLGTQRETFDKNLRVSLDGQARDIVKYQNLLANDQEIIRLRQQVSLTAASQLENGVITSSDYITELNQETIARLNLESHKIQLVKSRLDYLTQAGKL